jgi:dCMP deaminase
MSKYLNQVDVKTFRYQNYFMEVAKMTSNLSFANRLKVGAVAVKNNRILLTGFNGTPPGMSNCCENDQNETLSHVSHAEENLITYAAKQGISLKNCQLYVTASPCLNCSRLIYNSGFDIIYYENEYKSLDGVNYLKNLGLEVAKI